jgi:hemin uptake protein HemP
MVKSQPQQPALSSAALKRVSSESLLGQAKELLIVHNGREYRLRLTQNGKLILTA